MTNGNGDGDGYGEEFEEALPGTRFGRIPDLVITPAEYGSGAYAGLPSLEQELKALAETQYSEQGFQINGQRGGRRFFMEVVTAKPKERVVVPRDGVWRVGRDGKPEFPMGEREPILCYAIERKGKNPFLISTLSFGISDTVKQKHMWEEVQKLQQEIENSEVSLGQVRIDTNMFVLSPELNHARVRQDIGPGGRYPNWMYHREIRRVSRSYHRMRRALKKNPGSSRLEVMRKLHAEDIAKREDFTRYRVFYPAVGAGDLPVNNEGLNKVPPPHKPNAPMDEWREKDNVYRRALRLKLRPKEPDQWYYFVENPETGELEELSEAEKEALRSRVEAEYYRNGANVREGVFQEFPEGLHYNPHTEKYEIDVGDLNIKGRTMLAHKVCSEKILYYTDEDGTEYFGYGATWKYFEETVRRKQKRDPKTGEVVSGFRIPTEEEMIELEKTKGRKALKKWWARWLRDQDSFVDQNMDRSYPSEQMNEPWLLADIFGAQTSDPVSQAQALKELVQLAVYVEQPSTVTWVYRPGKSKVDKETGKLVYQPSYGSWEPVVDHSTFRYRAENIERRRKRLHRIQFWQMARSMRTKREGWNMEDADVARYVQNNFGGEWESIDYTCDRRYMILHRCARFQAHLLGKLHRGEAFAPIPSPEEIPDKLVHEEWQAVFSEIKEPTRDEREAYVLGNEIFERFVEVSQERVELRRSLLDWAWFFKEPWQKMPHDGAQATLYAEAMAVALDQLKRERGLNSAAGDGAMPDFDTLVKEFTSRVRNYRDEDDWTRTIEFAVRDPITVWLQNEAILGQMNALAVLNVRLSNPNTYGYDSFIRVNYDNATAARNFMYAMWAHQPEEPKRARVQYALQEAMTNRVQQVVPVVRRNTEGLPTIVIPKGRFDLGLPGGRRIGMERMIWDLRRPAIAYQEEREMELTLLGRAHAFSGGTYGSWISEGYPFRIGDDAESESKFVRDGEWVWWNRVFDNSLGKARARELGHWSETDELEFVKESAKSLKGNSWWLSRFKEQDGVQRGKAMREMDVDRLTVTIARWAKIDSRYSMKLAEMIVDKYRWDQINNVLREAIRNIGEEEKQRYIRYIKMVYMGHNNLVTSAVPEPNSGFVIVAA